MAHFCKKNPKRAVCAILVERERFLRWRLKDCEQEVSSNLKGRRMQMN